MRLKILGLATGVVMAGGVIVGASSTHAGQVGTGGGSGGDDRPAHAPSAAITTAERARVAEVVGRQDAGVVLHAVRRGPDGTFHALGSKGGEPVLAQVSRQLTRVEIQERPGA